MRLIADANVLFSAFIKLGTTRRLVLYDVFELYTPKFVIEEFFEHINELSEKTGIDEEGLNIKIKEFFSKSNIKLYSKKDIGPFLIIARQISPDEDDVMYFAAALKLDCPIWSNDKKLKEQSKVKIYSTKELIELLTGQQI